MENTALPITRRGPLKSHSSAAPAPSLEDVMRLARPAFGQQATQPKSPPATPARNTKHPRGWGVSFIDIDDEARETLERPFSFYPDSSSPSSRWPECRADLQAPTQQPGTSKKPNYYAHR